MTPAPISSIVSPPSVKASPGCSSVIACRSAPAQKQPPAPVRMATRMSGLALISSHAALIPSIIGRDSALRRSGRFIVRIITCPSRSTSRCWSSGVSVAVTRETQNTF